MDVDRHARELVGALEALTNQPIAVSTDDPVHAVVDVPIDTSTHLIELLARFGVQSQFAEEAGGVVIANGDIWRAARAIELSDGENSELTAAVRAGKLEPNEGLVKYRALAGSIKPNEWADLDETEQADVIRGRAEHRSSPGEWAATVEAVHEAARHDANEFVKSLDAQA